MLDNFLTKVILVITGLLLSMTMWAGTPAESTKPSSNNDPRTQAPALPDVDWQSPQNKKHVPPHNTKTERNKKSLPGLEWRKQQHNKKSFPGDDQLF